MPKRTFLSAMVAFRLPLAARAFHPRLYSASRRGSLLGICKSLSDSIPNGSLNTASFASSGPTAYSSGAADEALDPYRLRSTATTGEEDKFWGVATYADRKERLDEELLKVGVDPARLDSDAAFLGAQGPALRLYRSFVLPKSEGALASASSPGRARSVAMQIAFACREADANQAAWVRNLDAAQVELAEKRALAPQEAMGGHASAQEVQQRQARSLVLVLDGLRSAENVGNLFRTAEASGCDFVVTCGSCPRPPDKAVLKTAVKSADYVANEHAPTALEAITSLQAKGFAVWALETTDQSERYTDPPKPPRQSQEHQQPQLQEQEQQVGQQQQQLEIEEPQARSTPSAYPQKVALVMGNEVTGVAPAALEQCDRVLAIPTFGVKNSLNVAVAGSIVAYEVIRAWSVDS